MIQNPVADAWNTAASQDALAMIIINSQSPLLDTLLCFMHWSEALSLQRREWFSLHSRNVRGGKGQTSRLKRTKQWTFNGIVLEVLQECWTRRYCFCLRTKTGKGVQILVERRCRRKVICAGGHELGWFNSCSDFMNGFRPHSSPVDSVRKSLLEPLTVSCVPDTT